MAAGKSVANGGRDIGTNASMQQQPKQDKEFNEEEEWKCWNREMMMMAEERRDHRDGWMEM